MTVVQTRDSVVTVPRPGEQAAEQQLPEARRRRTRPMSEYWDYRTAQWETRSRA